MVTRKILILSANPRTTSRLRLDKEAREIDEGLYRAKHRDQFELVQRWAVRPRDIHRAMLESNPLIVHFAGHGAGEEGLIFEDETGEPTFVTREALAGLFELFADQVECVVLNGCHSQVQAEAIAEHIHYVIGMQQTIGDTAAIAFTIGFYDALGAGRPFEFAYKLGCNAIQMEGASEHLIPILINIKKPRSFSVQKKDVLQDTSASYPNGAVSLDSSFYIQRSPKEQQVCTEILKPGALVRIKAPQEMGKTSLLLRVLDYAKSQSYRTVNLNLQQIDQAILSDLDRFLRWLCANVTLKLNLKPKLDDYWDEDIGSKVSCSLYFESYLLELIDSPLILALDEVNKIFEYPNVARDFLPLLRSWYEEAKRPSCWQKLRLIVIHSTEIYVPLQLKQSPFNVGLPIQLDDFTLQEVLQLAQRYKLNWTDVKLAEQLMAMVGGHPALVHIALYHLSRGEITLKQLLQNAPTSTGIYSHHLQRCWTTLQEDPELSSAFYTVMNVTVQGGAPLTIPIA